MKPARTPITSSMVFFALALAAVLSACAPDTAWVKSRAKALVGQPIPGQKGQVYDEASAKYAAEQEERYARERTGALVFGSSMDGVFTGNYRPTDSPNWTPPTPASMG